MTIRSGVTRTACLLCITGSLYHGTLIKDTLLLHEVPFYDDLTNQIKTSICLSFCKDETVIPDLRTSAQLFCFVLIAMC